MAALSQFGYRRVVIGMYIGKRLKKRHQASERVVHLVRYRPYHLAVSIPLSLTQFLAKRLNHDEPPAQS